MQNKGSWNRIVRGGDTRISRFHTEMNFFIGWRNIAFETPLTLAQKLSTIITGHRAAVPWWPLAAIKWASQHITSEMQVIEFGSGSSTLWLSERAGSVLAREHDESWCEATRRRITDSGAENATVEHKTGESYYSIPADAVYDFAVIDGEYRWKCIEHVFPKMKSGGVIYFDNSDSDKDLHHYEQMGISQVLLAQRIVRELQESGQATVQEVHGMIHGELYAGSGMLIYKV